MSLMSRILATETPAQVRLRRMHVLLLLAGFALLMAIRLPETWTHGRFLDEEVTVFFAYAWNFDPMDALMRPFAGYWNFAANSITVLLAEAVRADVVSLERAPYVTMVIGLATQLLPIFLLLTGTASWLCKPSSRMIACLLVVLSPGIDEVYLNIVHIQFHLALCVGIMLALDVPSQRSGRLLYRAILFIAPLCGPGAIMFVPVFGLRALVDRDRGRWLHLFALGAGTAVQLFGFYAPIAGRGMPLEPFLLGAGLFVRLIVFPIFGPLAGVVVGGLTFKAEQAGNLMLIPALAIAAVVGFAALAVWSLKRRDDARWLIGAALLVAIVSFSLGAAGQARDAHRFALMPLAGPRYNYLPVVLLSLAMLILSQRSEGYGGKIASAIIVLQLVVGGLFFRIGLPAYSDGPSWPAEVASWRANPNHQLRAWPKTVVADLSGRRHPCPKQVVPPGNPNDPRYCESGWLAAFYVPVGGQQ